MSAGAVNEKIYFDDSEGEFVSSELLMVTPVGPDLYRVEESSALGEVSYYDVIEAVREEDGLRLVRIVEPSGLKVYSTIMSKLLIESAEIAAVQDRVIALGGAWECFFGTMLILHIPPEAEASVRAEIAEIAARFSAA